MKFMFLSPQLGHVTLCCSQEKEPVITSWHVVCQASKHWQFVCGWKPLMQGMKEHRSAMLCLGATTNYSCLTIETLNYGLATVTGTNMFKPEISSYAFLFTKYSSIQSGRYKISSLTKSVSAEKKPWSTSFSTVLFPDYPNFEEQKWLSGENAYLPQM